MNSPLRSRQQIRLVDQQKTPPDTLPLLLLNQLPSLFINDSTRSDTDFRHIVLQILAAERERISCVDDLYDEVGSFDDSP